MKNLFCTLFFAIGIFFTVQAQSMDVYVGTDTPDTWTYQVADANGNFLTFTPISIGGGVLNATLPGPVALPLSWRIADLTTGCGLSGFTIPTVGSTIQGVCSGYTVYSTLSQAPGLPGNYTLIVKIKV